MQPKTKAENLFSNYLDNLGLAWHYERSWGSHKPDFTIYSNKVKKKVLAVVEIEEIDYNKEEKKVLKEKGFLTRSINPYQKIREKINTARKQLASARQFPCLLVIYNLVGLPPLPIITLGAMLGDLTINIPINKTGMPLKAREYDSFGKNGKMLNPYSGLAQNTTFSAVGLLQTITPDGITSGYKDTLSKLLDNVDIHNDSGFNLYLSKAKLLEKELKTKGFDVNKEEVFVDFVLNPYARIPLPLKSFEKGFTDIHNYDTKTESFTKTYSWLKSTQKIQ